MAVEPIRRALAVPLSAPHAFELFTGGFAQWWPPEYTWSGESLEWIGMEPRIAGACYEVGPHGFRCDFGRILIWQPGQRLVFTWQIGPDRVPQPDSERASLVEVRFLPGTAVSTRVELEHRDFARHGEGAADYRSAMDSPRGWDHILERYRALLG